ncbi:hypothetical protein DFH29DRAFT_287615 [Suillus ampliporus]|nr:hypothetical protein DFH29DRAFT_287615 [Suillus ampliporus]
MILTMLVRNVSHALCLEHFFFFSSAALSVLDASIGLRAGVVTSWTKKRQQMVRERNGKFQRDDGSRVCRTDNVLGPVDDHYHWNVPFHPRPRKMSASKSAWQKFTPSLCSIQELISKEDRPL